MPMDYKQYQEEVTTDIGTVLKDGGCQPILFIGSGFSKRYAKTPNWEELLRKLAEACPNIDKDYAYYKQTYVDLPTIGSIFAKAFREWAWGKGKSQFPSEYFNEKYPPEIFIKHYVAKLLHEFNPPVDGSFDSAELEAEIAALKAIAPHAIVTTNYDELLEPLFPEYDRVIGQTILRHPYLSIGEIFKIHGCISEPLSMVLTKDDYTNFDTDQKYLSAKLLTYFAEHPLVFIGYSANDENIKNVLHDVDRMVRPNFELIPNIYILEWSSDITAVSYPARDRVLTVGNNRNIRIKSITASSFEWVFRAFASGGTLENVNMKLLRSLLARTVQLIRHDVPTKRVEVNYATLEQMLDKGDSVATLLGIAGIGEATQFNAAFPYTLTGVAEKLGGTYWTMADQLITALNAATGFNMKASDNTYHMSVRTGKNSFAKKYSQAAVDLLAKVKSGDKYELAKDCIVTK